MPDRDGDAERAAQLQGQAPAVAPVNDEDFAALLLRALTAMATRSKRRQADLTAALRGAGLPADAAPVRAALRLLQAQGCIENLVPLSDGGLLLSVTQAALEQAGPVPQWLPLNDLDKQAD